MIPMTYFHQLTIKIRAHILIHLFSVGFLSIYSMTNQSNLEYNVYLKNDWNIRSAADMHVSGKDISSPGIDLSQWVPATVPGTVLAVLVQNNIYQDIYYAKNFEQIPREPFETAWWYRKEFQIPNLTEHTELIFEGINYRVNIWLNGAKIADADTTEGCFRIFNMDVTQWINAGNNVLAVEVIPPKDDELTIGFVDWNPSPPDRSMGLWRGVILRRTGPVSLDHVHVTSQVNLNTLQEASLNIDVDLTNHTNRKIAGVVHGNIEGVEISMNYDLNPKERRRIHFTPEAYPILLFKNPRLWWPNNMGDPNLYVLHLAIEAEGKPSDLQGIRFGIREVSDYVNDLGYRGYKVNGKKVLLQGAGWVDDLLLADEDSKIEAQIKYARHMNLNTIRLEGFMGTDHKFYDVADENGILLMIGWSCQWEWIGYCNRPSPDGFMCIRTPEDIELQARAYRDQVIWLRNHPSILAWVYGSDKLPVPELETRLNDYIRKEDPTRPVLISCDENAVDSRGEPSRVKMVGPYDYVPPRYWYTAPEPLAPLGLNTETGPGPQPPPLETLMKMIPDEHLWPVNEYWNYHSGRKTFGTIDKYLNAFNHRYGPVQNVEEFALKAQAASYEAMRGMFEAFRVNQPKSTGVILWMLNSAWPEMFWQLYDWYLVPNGAFYGVRTACQPLQLIYHYGNGDIYTVNNTLETMHDLIAQIRIFDMHSQEIYQNHIEFSIDGNSSLNLFSFPDLNDLTATHFLDLRLKNKNGEEMADNFYWLSTKQDTMDFSSSSWFWTPEAAFTDLTGLNKLPEVNIEVEYSIQNTGEAQEILTTLKNPTDKIAFCIELNLVNQETEESLLPVFWSDNYVSLLPGETKHLIARLMNAKITPALKFQGWNINLQKTKFN